MRSWVIILCLGLAAAHPQPYEASNPEDPDIDHMIALLGEGGLGGVETASSSSSSQRAESSESSYFVSTGGDSIQEITVAEAEQYGLTCMPAGALTQSADIIVQESEDEGAAAASSASEGAAAASAAAGDTAASAAAGSGGVSSSAAAGDSASSAAAAGDSASSAAAAGDSASSAAAAGDSASSAAAAGDSASSAAAAGDSASSAAAAGDSAASAAAAGESAASAAQTGYEIESGEEEHSSEEVEEIVGGECVPYYLCKDGEIVSDGAGLIDMRFGGDDEESKSSSLCPNFLDVFCKVPLSEQDPDFLGDLTEYEYEPSCGHRNPQGVSIILDGFKEGESQFAEFPWMGIILEDELLDYDQMIQRYVCGCSLIHPQVIMTGAHCINGKNASKLAVRLGDWDTQNEKEIFPHEEHRVASMEIHERFNSANLRYDVGLLFLEEPVVLQQHIDTICLPAENEDFDYASCVATGFGKDQFHGGRFQNIMKQVDLTVMPHRKCQDRLRKTRLGRWFRLHRTFTCAGGEDGVDTCRGDGGSPLVCPSKEDPSKYVQAGIVAWGIGCGEDGVPGVYASVPKLVGWVNQKMADFFTPKVNLPPSPPPPPQHAYGALPPV